MSTTLISGILSESFGNQGPRAGSGPMTSSRIALVICLSSTLAIDVCVTTTTIVFIWRTYTGLREHNGIFRIVWQIIWFSSAPPLIILTISIVNSGSQPLTVIVGGIGAKFCNLSLMINLIGQDCIRRKFEETRSPQLPTISESRTPGIISDPVFAISMTSLDAGNAQGTMPRCTPIANHSDMSVAGHGEDSPNISDTSIVKPEYPEAGRSVQVRFSFGP